MFEPKLEETLSVADTSKSGAQLVYTRIELQNGQAPHHLSPECMDNYSTKLNKPHLPYEIGLDVKYAKSPLRADASVHGRMQYVHQR